MGRQRNNPHLKGDETEASNLSDIEFKVMVIRMFKALCENYKELSGNYISMKKTTKLWIRTR